jgi:hypothetical protein
MASMKLSAIHRSRMMLIAADLAYSGQVSDFWDQKLLDALTQELFTDRWIHASTKTIKMCVFSTMFLRFIL